MNFTAIILAAGTSSRFDKINNKLFQKINSIPLIEYSLNFFLQNKVFNQIIIVSSKENFEFFSKTYSSDRVFVTIGGKNRQESVYKSLLSVSNDYVLIHDGARPLISSTYVDYVLLNIKKHKAITIGSKLNDTVHVYEDSNIIGIIDRNSLVKVYTPQAFKTSIILEAHTEAVNTGYLGSDDISLISKFCEFSPFIFFSEDLNIKLTRKSDLILLEAILNENR